MKGAVVAVACVAAVGCSSDKDLFNHDQMKEDLQANFKENVMKGQENRQEPFCQAFIWTKQLYFVPLHALWY
jgi:hypothetical protein